MAKSGKGVRGRNDTSDDCDEQCDEGDKVVSPATPDQENEYKDEKRK
jgi:hypothetical protein